MSPLIKNTLILSAVIITGAAGYYFYTINKKSGVVSVDNDLISVQAEIETQQFLRILNELKGINLSEDILADDRMSSLVDLNLSVQPQEVGRYNPFEATE